MKLNIDDTFGSNRQVTIPKRVKNMALNNLHSARDFFRIWFSWKVYAVSVFLIIVGGVVAFCYIHTPEYESTAKILLLPKTSEGAIISTGTDEKRVKSVSIEDVNTEIELLTSDAVMKDTVRSFSEKGLALKSGSGAWYTDKLQFLNRAVNRTLIFLRFAEDLSPFDSKVEKLRRLTSVKPIAMSNIILVSLRAENPKSAQAILNTLLEIYVSHHDDVFTKKQGLDFFSEQSGSYYKKLEIAERKLEEFQKQWNIVDFDNQNTANIKLLSDLNQELKRIKIEIDQRNIKVALSKKSLAKNDQDFVITKEMRTIPSVVELEKSIVPLLIKRSEILKNYTPSSREYQDIETQIQMLRKEMRKEIRKAIATDELELESLRVRQDSLQERIEKLLQETNALGQRERILKDLEREIALYEKSYLLYASKAEESRIFSERAKRNLANITIADKASIPVTPHYPNLPLMLAIAIIGGLFVAIGTPFLLELFDRRLKFPTDIEDQLSLPVICSIPDQKYKQ